MSHSSHDQATEFYTLGVAAATAGQHDLAIAHFRRSLSLQAHFKTHHALARSLELRGALVEAFRHYEHAYNLNSRNDRVAVDFARSLIARGDRATAVSILG